MAQSNENKYRKKISFGTEKIHCKEPKTDKLQSLKVDT